MKKLFLLTLLALFSCIKSGFEEVNSPPSWFLEVKGSNVEVYATGSGASKEDAVQMALLNATSQIKTSISASIRTESQMMNGKFEEQMKVRALNEVERFSFSGYEITNTAFDKKSQLFYAEVKLNKLKIYNQKLIEYESKKEEIEEILRQEKNNTLSVKIENAKIVKQKSLGFKNDILILNALNGAFDFKSEFKRASYYETYYQNLISSFSFKVVEAPSEVYGIVESILKEKSRNSKGTVVNFYLNFNTSFGKIYDMFSSKTTVKLEVIIADEKFVEKTFTFRATSSVSEAEAYKASFKDFETQFKAVIEEVL
jgi:hypothetical protein